MIEPKEIERMAKELTKIFPTMPANDCIKIAIAEAHTEQIIQAINSNNGTHPADIPMSQPKKNKQFFEWRKRDC